MVQVDWLEEYCQAMEAGQYEESDVEDLVALRLCPAYIVPQVGRGENSQVEEEIKGQCNFTDYPSSGTPV